MLSTCYALELLWEDMIAQITMIHCTINNLRVVISQVLGYSKEKDPFIGFRKVLIRVSICLTS